MAKILVTDDAAFMRMMLKGILMNEGHEVVEAVDGADMLHQYDIIMPDMVLLDITMPKMDGLEALRALKGKYPEAKVVMCSAMGQQAMVIDAIHSGAKDFICKPFDKDRVIQAVVKVLN
jgi:two-component system chemotaxis response regulator CheY